MENKDNKGKVREVNECVGDKVEKTAEKWAWKIARWQELARVRSLQGAFAPIEVVGDLTPESDEGGHLTEVSEEGPEEEGNDREETSL